MLLAGLRSRYAGKIGFGTLKYSEIGSMGESPSVIAEKRKGALPLGTGWGFISQQSICGIVVSAVRRQK